MNFQKGTKSLKIGWQAYKTKQKCLTVMRLKENLLRPQCR